MEAQSLINIAQILIGGILLLVLVNLYLVVKLKEIDPFRRWDADGINGFLFIFFGVVGMVVAGIAAFKWYDLMILVKNPASEHGQDIDRMFWNTMWVSVAVVILTNTLMFYYAWRYRSKPGRKALYYPANDTMEIIWTAIPAVVLILLIGDGIRTWHNIFRDPPSDAIQIELNGKQYDWTIRYPGTDDEFGLTSVEYINDAQANTIGFNFEDEKGHDDIVVTEIHMPVNRAVNFTIKSRDVLHSATLPHFRMKMDAVPGMATNFWLTPTMTTEEMREKTGNPEFNYEMSCQQICGGGHWNMRRVIIVETEEEFQQWLNEQKPFYATWKENNAPDTKESAEPDTQMAEEEVETDRTLSMND